MNLVERLLSTTLLFAVAANTTNAGTAVRLYVEGLVKHADLAFEGRVLSVRPLATANGRVESEVFVVVHRTFWGLPQGTRTFRVPGGVLPDGSGMVVPGMPAVTPGEDAVFFLSEPSPSGLRVPVGLGQGVMHVATRAGGERSLTRAWSGLGFVDPASGQAVGDDLRRVLDYGATVARIEAAALEREVNEAMTREGR